jgi:hypothetical protein
VRRLMPSSSASVAPATGYLWRRRICNKSSRR